MCAAVGEKDAEDKDLNSEAPSSPSEATSEKDANSVSQSNAVSGKKEEERSNSVKKVIRVEFIMILLHFATGGHCSLNFTVKKLCFWFILYKQSLLTVYLSIV